MSARAIIAYVIAYARLSVEDMRADAVTRGRSLERQFANIRARCKREGWELVEEVHDEDKTGKNFVRPGIDRITEIVRTQPFPGKPVTIIVGDSSDRIGRQVRGWDAWYYTVLEPAGVCVELCTGSLKMDTAEAWLFSTFGMTLNQFQSMQISQKVKNANMHKRKKGKLIGGRPVGTMRGGDSAGQRVKDPATFFVVPEAFTRRAAGESFGSIAADFNRRGIPTAQGKLWYPSAVRSMIRCRWWIGETMHKGQINLDSDGAPVRCEHDAMLPRELWEAANRWRGKPRAKDGHIYLLCDPRRKDRRSLVICSGWVMTAPASKAGLPAEYKGRTTVRGHFYRRMDQDSGLYSAQPCDKSGLLIPASIPAEELEQEVMERLLLACRTNETLSSFVTQAGDERRNAAARQRTLAGEVLALRGLRLKAEAALVLAAESGGALALPALNRKVELLDAQLAALESELSELALAPLRMSDLAPDDFLERLRDAWERGDRLALRDFLGEMLACIDVRPDGIYLQPKGPAKQERTAMLAGLYVPNSERTRRYARLAAARN